MKTIRILSILCGAGAYACRVETHLDACFACYRNHRDSSLVRRVVLFSAMLLGVVGVATSTNVSRIVTQIAGDMSGGNEGHPHGIPSFWGLSAGPSVSDGNHASTSCKGTPCGAFDYWGTVYIEASGNPSTNTRVNIRNCQALWLNSSTHQWTKWGPDTAPEGVEDYPEKFDGPTTPANLRKEPDGSISVLPAPGKTSHFYGPYPRIPIDPAHFAGVVNVCEMRLILDNPTGPDDRATARFVANVGGDYYPKTTGPGILNNRGIGGGKFKYVKASWRSFAMTTLTEKQLLENPPPITLDGALP